MKKIAAIVFLITFLFSTTELYQVFKIPQLITHYQEHQQLDSNISFWQFLCIHYAHGNVKDADHDKDMKLPFKTNDYAGHIVSSVLVPYTGCHLCIASLFYPLQKGPIHSSHLVPWLLGSNIWQPPRSC